MKAGERLGADEWQTVQKTEEGKGWRHYSEVSTHIPARVGLGETKDIPQPTSVLLSL